MNEENQSINKNQIRLLVIGALSVVLSIALIGFTLDIGKNAANFGDRFSSQQVFKVSEETSLFEKPESTRIRIISPGEVFEVLGEEGNWIKVDPVPQLSNSSRDSQLKQPAFIAKDKGDILSPFQLNLRKFMYDEIAENDRQNYELGSFITFFTTRTNVIYIYYAMAFLLIVFNWHTLKRIYSLWQNYNSHANIENNVFNNKDGWFKEIEKVSQKDKLSMSEKFLVESHNSFMKEGSNKSFEKIYKRHTEKDGENLYEYMEVTRNSNVWIIRAGIFGTLLGLVIAFFELYLAMTTMETDAKLSPDFIVQIQQALLGNSLAVATSITAHGIALVLEVVISSFMRKESNSMWLDHAFAQLSTFEKYTPEISSTTELFGPLSLSTDEMVNELETAKNELSELTPKTTKASGLLEDLNDHIHDLNSSLKSFGDKVTNASEVTSSIGDNYRELTTSTGNLTKKIDEATNTISKLNEYYDNYVNSMEKSVKSIQDSSSQIFSGLMSGLTDLGEKLTNLGESNEDKGQDI